MPRNSTSKSNPKAVKTAYASKGTSQYIEPPKKIKAHKLNKPKLIPRDNSIVNKTLADIKKFLKNRNNNSVIVTETNRKIKLKSNEIPVLEFAFFDGSSLEEDIESALDKD